MFPLRDENPTEITPWVTVAIIAANAAVWVLVQGAGTGTAFLESICRLGAIPAELTGAMDPGETVPLGPRHRCEIGGAAWSTVLSSMFMHGGWGHLIMNMWFLWVFGNNIEDAMGHGRFVVFYLAAGVLGTAAHVATAMESGVPMVGASGAISGVMGAYVVLYPRVRVDTLFFFFIFIRVIPLPAWIMLGYWIALQFLQGIAGPGVSGGVAVWAHVGGFVAGVVLVGLFRRPDSSGRRRRGGSLW
jgi:membrane associated rhomboid family serine protease